MVSVVVSTWLQRAGLQQYVPNFAHVSEGQFVNLLMQDYPKFGVVEMEDKQKLFRLIKNINREVAENGSQYRNIGNAGPSVNVPGLDFQTHHLDGNAGLLDLDAHDGDLLFNASHPFQLSPVSDGRERVKIEPSQNVLGVPEEDPPKIRVVVRKRPLNRKEKEKAEEDIVDVSIKGAYVIVNETKVKVDLTKYVEKHQFNFDVALDENVTNEQVYQTTVQPLVHTLFKSGKASCFAYGQTGSGKTYTMSPLPVRAAGDIIKYLALPQNQDIALYISCFEIYGNKVFDLLNARKKLNILEDGKRKVVVVGLKEHNVTNTDHLKQLMEDAANKRSVGSTAANADSSRSHSIMQFALKRAGGADGQLKVVGKISFIDLAGSERGADTFDNNRQTRLEGAEINKSLLALKECIRALDADARHVPFRGSKLTAVLRDSFVGEHARTVMIANISPNHTSVEHTLNTLRYADRVKELRKERSERAPGAVTPADPNYYAAAQRTADPEPEPPSTRQVSMAAPTTPRRDVRVEQQQQVPNYAHQSSFAQPLNYVQPPVARHQAPVHFPAEQVEVDFEDDELINARDELVNTILEEEEELIMAHRAQIEETMDIVRNEMNLLAEVDAPGSAIDVYVDRLETILTHKARSIAALKQKLDSFKSKLREEEMVSKTIVARGWQSPPQY